MLSKKWEIISVKGKGEYFRLKNELISKCRSICMQFICNRFETFAKIMLKILVGSFNLINFQMFQSKKKYKIFESESNFKTYLLLNSSSSN